MVRYPAERNKQKKGIDVVIKKAAAFKRCSVYATGPSVTRWMHSMKSMLPLKFVLSKVSPVLFFLLLLLVFLVSLGELWLHFLFFS